MAGKHADSSDEDTQMPLLIAMFWYFIVAAVLCALGMNSDVRLCTLYALICAILLPLAIHTGVSILVAWKIPNHKWHH